MTAKRIGILLLVLALILIKFVPVMGQEPTPEPTATCDPNGPYDCNASFKSDDPRRMDCNSTTVVLSAIMVAVLLKRRS